MSNQRKTQKIGNYFPKISSIVKWLRDIKTSLSVLLRLIKLRYPFGLIRCQIVNLLNYTLIYPVGRIMLGRKIGGRICVFLLHASCSSKILPLPAPLKSKIMVLQGEMSYGSPYIEIYILDAYNIRLLKEGMIVVDVGANIGVYTVLAAEKVGKNGKVIAIEPEPKNYQQLLKNIKLNNFQNVTPINIALADHNGIEKLYISYCAGLHSLIASENTISSIKVSLKTVDKLLEELNLKKIDIIKIDTEGSELPVLRGAEKTLKANPNMKIIVATEHYPSETKEVRQFLNDRGFKITVSRNGIVMAV